jgi:hypothetical protein
MRVTAKLTEDEHILQIAQQTRDAILGEFSCTTAVCLEASKALSEKLNEAGYNAKVVEGTFEIDFPDQEYYDEEDEDMYIPKHFWVEVNNKLLDITADQFQDEVDGEELQEIAYGTYQDYPRYERSPPNIHIH